MCLQQFKIPLILFANNSQWFNLIELFLNEWLLKRALATCRRETQTRGAYVFVCIFYLIVVVCYFPIVIICRRARKLFYFARLHWGLNFYAIKKSFVMIFPQSAHTQIPYNKIYKFYWCIKRMPRVLACYKA